MPRKKGGSQQIISKNNDLFSNFDIDLNDRNSFGNFSSVSSYSFHSNINGEKTEEIYNKINNNGKINEKYGRKKSNNDVEQKVKYSNDNNKVKKGAKEQVDKKNKKTQRSNLNFYELDKIDQMLSQRFNDNLLLDKKHLSNNLLENSIKNKNSDKKKN